MKNKNINMLIISFLVISAFAVMLIIFVGTAKRDFAENIKVSQNGLTEDVFTVRDLRLNPSESKEYSANLVCAASGTFAFELSYEEKTDGGLKQFINVTITADGAVVYQGSLQDLINNGLKVNFKGELQAKEPLVLTFHYEMPREIGNEAQGTYSDFDVHIKVEKCD